MHGYITRIVQRLQGSGAGRWDLHAALQSLAFQAGQSVGALTLAQGTRSAQARGRQLACRGSLGYTAQDCCSYNQKTNGRSHGGQELQGFGTVNLVRLVVVCSGTWGLVTFGDLVL